jgi:hypothetical protein
MRQEFRNENMLLIANPNESDLEFLTESKESQFNNQNVLYVAKIGEINGPGGLWSFALHEKEGKTYYLQFNNRLGIKDTIYAEAEVEKFRSLLKPWTNFFTDAFTELDYQELNRAVSKRKKSHKSKV